MTDLAIADTGEYRPRIVMAAEDAKALDDQLRAMQLAVLRPKVDYDTIPGMGDKPTLLKPGAEKLIQWFGFGSRSVEIKTELDDPERPSGVADTARRVGVTYRTDVTKTIPGVGEILVARCEGYAGYDEDRFFQTAEQARARAEANERRWASKDNRAPRAWKWENATGHRAPWNTLIKMAQKRSYVGAAIDATAAAGLFTQDLEDMTPPPGTDDGNGSAGPPPDYAWDNAAPAPPRHDDQPAGDGPKWTMTQALKAATGFGSEAEGNRLWREAGQAVLDGHATPKQRDKIQNIIGARIAKRRKQAAADILGDEVPDGDDWRTVILDLADDQAARDRIAEVRQLAADGQMAGGLAELLGRAIIAMRPRAAVKAGDGDE